MRRSSSSAFFKKMDSQDKNIITGLIRDKAIELGFDLFGIAPAATLSENGEIISQWCAAGMNGGMEYISRNIARRIDPRLVLEDTRSVIVTGLNYYTERKQGGGDVPVVSRYAYGRNYHDVIIEKLNHITALIGRLDENANSRAFVDSAPVLEKAWASRAGLGWQGRHSILVNRRIGSFFFLGVILTDLTLEYNEPAEDLCGNCTMCIDACPTDAINNNRTIDARRCISYLTLEEKAPLDNAKIESLQGRIAGCDICQEACPWNKQAAIHKHPEFDISEELRSMTSHDWLNMTSEDHRRIFGNSAINYRKYEIFIQNVKKVTTSLRKFT
jgi:epoxyqueuosine reductase